MKKLVEVLIQSNLYIQIAFCALYRLFKILFHLQVGFFFILLFFLSQITFIPFQDYLLLGLRAGFLWIIANMAKPSLLYPVWYTARVSVGFWLFCSLIFLLYSLSSCFFLGIFLALQMIVGSFFLMNGIDGVSIKKNIFNALFYTCLLFWNELVAVFTLFLLLSLVAWFFYACLPIGSLFCIGYILVFTQLIVAKSLCTNNDLYYHQGS